MVFQPRSMGAGRAGRSLRLDDDHAEPSWAVNALDPLQLDVARGRRAADPRQRAARLEPRQRLRDAADDLFGADDTDVEVGKQAERPAALIGSGVEDDRAGVIGDWGWLTLSLRSPPGSPCI